jgi:plastocyanin
MAHVAATPAATRLTRPSHRPGLMQSSSRWGSFDVMKYDKTELTVRAGQRARLVFRNTDHMQHNVLILRPGTLEAVGALADQMLTDAQALAKNFSPTSGDVLFSTPLVNPSETFELRFTAPAQPGRYPYICTFPGHWRMMQGTLVVTP